PLMVLGCVTLLAVLAGCGDDRRPRKVEIEPPKAAAAYPYDYYIHPDNALANTDNNKYIKVPDRKYGVDLLKGWWAKFVADAGAVDDVTKVVWYIDGDEKKKGAEYEYKAGGVAIVKLKCVATKDGKDVTTTRDIRIGEVDTDSIEFELKV